MHREGDWCKGSITLTIDLERGIAVRMQENRMASARLV